MPSTPPATTIPSNPDAHLLRLPKEIRDMIYSYVYPELTTSQLFSDAHHNITLRLGLAQTSQQLRKETLDLVYANGTTLLYSDKAGFSPLLVARRNHSPPSIYAAPIGLIKRVSLSLNLASLPPYWDFTIHHALTGPIHASALQLSEPLSQPRCGYFAPKEVILRLCTCNCTFQRRTMFWVSKFRSIILTLLSRLPKLERISVYHCHVVRLSLSEMWDAVQFPDVVTTMFEGEARYGGPWSCTFAKSSSGTTWGDDEERGEGVGIGDDDERQGVERYVLKETASTGDVVRIVALGFWDSWEGYNLPCVRYKRDKYGIPCCDDS